MRSDNASDFYMQQSQTETNMATRIDKNSLGIANMTQAVEGRGRGPSGLQDASDCQGKVKYNAVTWQLHKQIAG